MRFQALQNWEHCFTLRHPEMPVNVVREEAVRRLKPWHDEVIQQCMPGRQLRTAEQVHRAKVSTVHAGSNHSAAGADALITADPRVALGIYVADCCAIYLVDTVTGAVGLAHSGKKGTELNILTATLAHMNAEFGTQANNIIAQLSPCIRPPAYEIDFAARIRSQCASAGIPTAQIHDEGLCTSQDLERFYSYRIEKGFTGRMLAVLACRRA
jgi:copper oxidase (laccase) domain-containing protein